MEAAGMEVLEAFTGTSVEATMEAPTTSAEASMETSSTSMEAAYVEEA